MRLLAAKFFVFLAEALVLGALGFLRRCGDEIDRAAHGSAGDSHGGAGDVCDQTAREKRGRCKKSGKNNDFAHECPVRNEASPTGASEDSASRAGVEPLALFMCRESVALRAAGFGLKIMRGMGSDMAMLRAVLGTVLLLACAACSDIWTVSRIEQPIGRAPSGQAVFFYGITGYPVESTSVWFMDFMKYLPPKHQWDHNCFVHHSWRGAPDSVKGGETHYYAFTAPAGHYAYAEASLTPVKTWVFATPAGQATYFGTFDLNQKREPGAPYITRRVDLEGAAAFARSLNLPAPRVAEPTFVEGFPWPGCSEAGSTFG